MTAILRPNQVSDYAHTKESLQNKLKNDHIQDKSAVRGQLKRAERDYDRQAPKLYLDSEVDGKLKEGEELLEKIKVGMPSGEEMRKNPPGAVNKHRTWERRNKSNIESWKEIQLRLNVGTDDHDIANLERHRPTHSTLNMHGAQIEGTQYHMGDEVGKTVVLSSDELVLIKERAPDVYAKLCVLDADQRALAKQMYVTDFVELEGTSKDSKEEENPFNPGSDKKQSGRGQRRDK